MSPLATDEPRGRWENRCDYVWLLNHGSMMTSVRAMVCDRPDGHHGLHSGRLFRFGLDDRQETTVIGYARRPQ